MRYVHFNGCSCAFLLFLLARHIGNREDPGTRYVSFSCRNALSLYHESEVFEFPVQYLLLISSMGLKP